MRAYLICALVIGSLLLSACARARVTTTIQADGSWARTVMLTGQEKKEGSMQVAPTLDDTFVVPSGTGWKSHQEKKGDDVTITFERAFAPGSKSDADVSIKGETPDKLSLVNEVTVTRAGPRRFEYRETLHWKGDPPKTFGNIKPEDLAAIRASLPKDLATEANARALAERASKLAIPMMFGPGDPLLAMGLLHPDLAERRAGQRLGALLLKALEEQFGDKMKPAERKEVARRLIQATFSSTKVSAPDASAGPPSSKGPGLTPLMFIVKGPGRIVSSNGEVDELTGEVFWAMFSEAAAFQDVVLTAVVEQQ